MVLENVTSIITGVAGSTVTAVESNPYVWLFLIVGGIIGTFAAMMLPFLREKRKFGKEGIDLFFDKDFLKVGATALVISIIGIGSIYPTLLSNANPSASYGSAFISAATLAFTLNVGGSWIIGSNNATAQNQLIEKKANVLVAMKLQQQKERESVVENGSGATVGPTDSVGGVTQPTTG